MGLVVGGLILGAWGGFRRRILTTMMGLVGMGCGMLVVGWAPAHLFTLAPLGMACIGLMIPLTDGPLFAILQARVPAELQGRVFTVIMSLSAAAGPLGLALAGPLAAACGAQVWFRLAGPAFILAAIGGSLLPAVTRLDDGPPQRQGETRPAVWPAVRPNRGRT